MFDAIFHKRDNDRNDNGGRNNNEEMIGIIYTRKSSEKGDANTSLSSQVRYSLDLAEQRGIYVDDDMIFQDNFTGMTLNRPEFNKVMKLLRSGKANTLIVYAPDRLTRVPYDGATLRNEFRRLGVRLFIVTRGEVEYSGIYEAFNYMQDAASEDWRNRLIEATSRGIKTLQDEGIIIGQQLKFGYERVGKRQDAKIVIVETEAKIIRLIFDLFVVKRWTALQIADELNARGIPTRSESKRGFTHTSGNWIPANIYAILKDEAYIGIVYQNKWYAGGREKPREEWKRAKDIPAIISGAVFQKAQELLADGRSKNAKTGTNEYLIGRRVFCAVCGYKMVGKPGGDNRYNYTYYRCPTRDSKYNNRACDNKMYHVNEVDCTVWKWLAELVQNPRAIIAAYKETQREIDEDLEDTTELIAAYERSLQKHHDALADMADLYRERLITKDIFREKKMILDQQIEETQKRLREAEDHLDQHRITDRDIQRIETVTTAIRNKIRRGEQVTFEERRQLIDDLNITFKLGIENGKKVVLIYWAIYEVALDVTRDCEDLAQNSSSLPACRKPQPNGKCVLIFTVSLETL